MKLEIDLDGMADLARNVARIEGLELLTEHLTVRSTSGRSVQTALDCWSSTARAYASMGSGFLEGVQSGITTTMRSYQLADTESADQFDTIRRRFTVAVDGE